MNKLNRPYFSQNISIDNALSMNQILHQIVNHIKEIVDFINNLELRANEYTDQEILKLKNDLEDQLATLEQTLKTYTDDSIDTYNAEIINPQLTEIRNTIDTLRRTLNERIDNEVGILNRRIDSEVSTLNRIIEDTKTYLEDLIKKGMAYVYSSISGLHLPLQNVLGEIGNVLKQTLSYNWNSIDEFKEVESEDSADGFRDIPNTNNYMIKGGNSLEWNISYYSPNISFYFNPWGAGFSASDNVIIDGVETDIVISQDTIIPTTYFDGKRNTTVTFNLIAPNSQPYIIELIIKNINAPYTPIVSSITFNSIKLAMQELNVNYNSLAYTGVNTFYELNETEKLFDTDGVKSDYFTGNKYKVIHNNFDSDFFAYEEEENNENEGE